MTEETTAEWMKRAMIGDWIKSKTIPLEEYERLKDCEERLNILREMILRRVSR